MTSDVPGDFTATGRVTHQRDVVEIEGLDDGGRIVGGAVHVVAGGGLAGPAVASPVMCDCAEAVLHEKQHLAVPCIGVQRPAVGEGDDGTLAPVLVVDLGAVLGGDGT